MAARWVGGLGWELSGGVGEGNGEGEGEGVWGRGRKFCLGRFGEGAVLLLWVSGVVFWRLIGSLELLHGVSCDISGRKGFLKYFIL